jgi:hypothetical protein
VTVFAEAAPCAPDLVEPLIGYRQWRLHEARLHSPFREYEWGRGVNTARCEVAAQHADPPPGHDCTCGLHAWYRPCPRLGYATADLVAGAVALWGEVELHPTGMRAQHAAIVALVLPLAHTAKRRRVIDAARALEVEVVPARQLTAAARAHGQLLAAGMAPTAR